MKVNRILLLVGVAVVLIPLAGPMVSSASGDQLRPDENIIVGIQGPGTDGKLAEVGSDGVTWIRADAASYHDVTRLENGSVLATFVTAGETECGPFPTPCARTGVRIIDLEPTPHVVWEWTYAVRSMGNSEVHDAELLPSGNIVIADMEYESIFILNPQTGERVWTWNASRVYSAPEDPTRTDWLHINDVDRIGEGKFLVSVRNANQLLVIQRGQGVVEVINKDRDPTLLRGQHNPQWLSNDSVLVADSSNDRVVELKRQPDGSWKPVWAVESANGLGFAWPRDADRLENGHTLITDSRNHRVVEVDEDGDVAAVWRTPRLPYDAEVGSGEIVGAPPSDVSNPEVPPGDGEGHLPVFGKLQVGLQHAIGLPYWVTEWHLATTSAGLLLVAVGLIGEVLEDGT